MAEPVAVDTDVLLKVAAYRMANEFVDSIAGKGPPSILGLTHIIAGKQLMRRRKQLRDVGRAVSELDTLLGICERLEPEDEEIRIAAEFAGMAQDRGLPLDPGEAQLAAIVASRALPLMVTGDKRAISALCQLVEDTPIREVFVGKLACFEQIISAVAGLIGEVAVRERICSEPEMDGAMRLACSCDRAVWDPVQLSEACSSFVGAVRTEVGDLLAGDSAFA
ncbi:MAG: hypothetical protein WCY11_17005 [Novosphingobium sp.]